MIIKANFIVYAEYFILKSASDKLLQTLRAQLRADEQII